MSAAAAQQAITQGALEYVTSTTVPHNHFIERGGLTGADMSIVPSSMTPPTSISGSPFPSYNVFRLSLSLVSPLLAALPSPSDIGLF
jgi:hypothetical protein